MSYVKLNGNDLPKEPSEVTDRRIYQQSEKEAIDGAMQRNRISTSSNPNGFKYESLLLWANLDPTSFAALDTYFMTGSGVAYTNTLSKYNNGTLTYSGLPFVEEEGKYITGDGRWADFAVRIRQI